MRHWKRFLANDQAATAVEYALLLGVIILGSVTTMGGFGVGMNEIYNIINSSLSTPSP